MMKGIPQRKDQKISKSMSGEQMKHMDPAPRRENGSMREDQQGVGYMKSMAPFSKSGADYNAEAYKY